VTLELGGKSPNIVFADCKDKGAEFLKERIEYSVEEVMSNTGQSCDAPTRLIVERSIYDEVLALAKARAEALVVGDPTDEKTEIGPLFDEIQYHRVQAMIKAGIDEDKVTLLCGGLGKPQGLETGWFCKPTIFADVDNAKHRVAREEIFGPVLAIIPFETGNEEEALRIANDTPYGLASFVQTGSRERAERVAKRLRAGYVRFNGDAPNYGTPFGGYKASGIGREGGLPGLEDYQETKSLHFGGL
jgi:aldehyde dehydrogenase (NAD+)